MTKSHYLRSLKKCQLEGSAEGREWRRFLGRTRSVCQFRGVYLWSRANSIEIPQPCRDNARCPLISRRRNAYDRLYRGGSIAPGTWSNVCIRKTARSSSLAARARRLRDEQPFLEYFRVTSSGVDRADRPPRAYLWIESARFPGKPVSLASPSLLFLLIQPLIARRPL